MVTGVGGVGAVVAGDAAGADPAGAADPVGSPDAAGAPDATGAPDAATGPLGAPGAPAPGAVATPTTRSSTASTDSMRPIVDTEICDVSVVISPDGKVRLFAARTPVTWLTEMPFAVSFSGS